MTFIKCLRNFITVNFIVNYDKNVLKLLKCIPPCILARPCTYNSLTSSFFSTQFHKYTWGIQVKQSVYIKTAITRGKERERERENKWNSCNSLKNVYIKIRITAPSWNSHCCSNNCCSWCSYKAIPVEGRERRNVKLNECNTPLYLSFTLFSISMSILFYIDVQYIYK